jgi:hypothetical protein
MTTPNKGNVTPKEGRELADPFANLDHPCKGTCSGWQQGYEKGQRLSGEINRTLANHNADLTTELTRLRAENEAFHNALETAWRLVGALDGSNGCDVEMAYKSAEYWNRKAPKRTRALTPTEAKGDGT